MINNPLIYKFLKDLTNNRQKTNRTVVFSSRPFPQFSSIQPDHQGDLQKSGKQDSFRHILKSSASMYESSVSQFFRTTSWIQSRSAAFDESMLVMTLLTILGVTEILCSFRLVLEGKTGKEMPGSSKLEFLETFLANNSALSDAEDNSSR